MKALFQKKISLKEIKQIEKNLAEKLDLYDKNYGIILTKNISKITDVYFALKPEGLSFMREIIDVDEHQKLKQKNRELQKIKGIRFYNKKEKKFEDLLVIFSNYQLNFICCENPNRFHKTYDINKITLDNLDIEKIPIENPDSETAKKILKITDSENLKKLDLEGCFEIEFEEKFYYTILDFEDGNYIAVDKKGFIYFLNHNANVRIRKINENISDFLFDYDGNKTELSKKLEY